MRLAALLFLSWFLVFLGGPVFGVTITDNDQRTLVFAQPFKRIISLYPAHTRNLLDLGLDNEIVAIGRSDKQLKDRPRVHFRDDPERLLALQPDLVLIRPMISRSYPQLIRRLEQSGVRVVSLQPAGVDELFAYWETLGKLTGREQQARAMITAFGTQIADFAGKTEKIPRNERKKVYFEAIHGRMKTFAPTSIAIFVLETAGGVNVAADAFRMRNSNIAAYGKERILAKAGEIDVFLAQQGRMNPITVAEIRQEPGFEVIKAVQEDRVFLVDEKLVSRPTMGLLAAITRVMELLYPDPALSKEVQ